ncbi:MAG: hypothetical protein HQ519_16500 [Planctomycetes bacterium]|nr:hypothetical protein [Planctomycetota bacterium]
MVTTSIWALILLVQGSGILKVAQPVEGMVTDEAPVVVTEELETNYKKAPTLGVDFDFVPPETGNYYFDLRSYDFDAYLILRNSNNQLLAEDDDGLLGTHSRIVFELEANQ